MNNIFKIVRALEHSNILLKGVTKTVKNETKEQKGGFLSILLGIFIRKHIISKINCKSWRKNCKSWFFNKKNPL